jgi:hypothetical protein
MINGRLRNAGVRVVNAPQGRRASRNNWGRWACAVAIGSSAVACDSELSGTADPPADSGMTMLEEVASIVIPNCAIGGCHDSVSETHSMDLSTADKIYDFWVGHDGFDHCTMLSVPRVIPGDPEGSLVVIKIAGIEVCSQSQRMPLPPRPMLAASQIETIRRWIAAGAPRGAAIGDAGPSDASSGRDIADVRPELSTCSDSGRDGPPPPYVPEPGDTSACTAASPCPTGAQCIGDGCGERWECIMDNDAKHPCPTDLATYCGCDGVTFTAANTCPDRPYQYAGPCDEGTNCDPTDLRCSEAEPSCPEGMLPSIIHGQYGPCVPFASCRCEYAWECPKRDQYVCDFVARHCSRLPTD